MSEYLIQGETLEAIGDEVRRLTDTESLLSPAQMATALAGVTVGSSGASGSESIQIPVHDEYKFVEHSLDYPSEYGEIGGSGISLDDNGSRIWALEYFKTVFVTPPINTCDNVDLMILNEPLVSIKLPSVVNAEDFNYYLSQQPHLVVAEFSSCTTGLVFGVFDLATMLERIVLNSAYEFEYRLFPSLSDYDHTLSLYLKGTTMGTCTEELFGDISEYNGGALPNLKIYVPPSLLNDFRTTWAGGVFSNNIYVDPEVSS